MTLTHNVQVYSTHSHTHKSRAKLLPLVHSVDFCGRKVDLGCDSTSDQMSWQTPHTIIVKEDIKGENVNESSLGMRYWYSVPLISTEVWTSTSSVTKQSTSNERSPPQLLPIAVFVFLAVYVCVSYQCSHGPASLVVYEFQVVPPQIQ